MVRKPALVNQAFSSSLDQVGFVTGQQPLIDWPKNQNVDKKW